MNPSGPQKQSLSPSEKLLRERLKAQAEPLQPVTWQELTARQETAIKPAQPARSKAVALWLTPFAAAAAVAWLMVVQPLSTNGQARPQTPMLLAGNYQLESIDRQIQQAYLRGADDATISALWQQREVLTAQETF